MASIADLFRLNDGSSWQNTLAQALSMINQYEQRQVQREGIAASTYGNELQAATSMRGQDMQSASNAATIEQRQQEMMQEADIARAKHVQEGERLSFDKMKAYKQNQIAQQNADTNRQNAYTNALASDRSQRRLDAKEGRESQDWQTALIEKESLSKALQSGGIEEYTKQLGKLGRADDMKNMLMFQDTYNKNVYLNNKTFWDANKTQQGVEAGNRIREGSEIFNRYMAAMQKGDSDGAYRQLQNDFGNSQFYQDFAGLDKNAISIGFPSRMTADLQSLSQGSKDESWRRSQADLYRGFGMEPPYNVPPEKGQGRQAPLVQIGVDSEGKIKAYGKEAENTLQKKIISKEQLQREAELLPTAEQMKPFLTGEGKLYGGVANFENTYTGTSSPEQEQFLKDRRAAMQPLSRFHATYVKDQSGASYTDKQFEMLREGVANGTLGPAEYEAAREELIQAGRQALDYMYQQEGRGGVPAEPMQDSTPPKYQYSLNQLYNASERAYAEGNDEAAEYLRNEYFARQDAGEVDPSPADDYEKQVQDEAKYTQQAMARGKQIAAKAKAPPPSRAGTPSKKEGKK